MQGLEPWVGVGYGMGMLLLVLWTLPWKGYALWKSARRGEKWWFIALLIVNTVGVLEILYIFVFSREAKGAEKEKTPPPERKDDTSAQG